MRTGQPLPDLDTVRQRIRADVPLAEAPTVAAYLKEWLAGLQIDPNTITLYESHVRVHLTPHLGHLRLDKLKVRHINAMFTAIRARNADIVAAKASPDADVRATVRGIRPTGPATCQRIRGTLRKAINDAIAAEIIAGPNPAVHVKTPGDRVLPIVWEPERIERWKTTGEVPGPVMVWTDDLVAAFLDYAAEHAPDLHPMLHFIAYRGPRRGEACGLLDSEVRLAKKEASVVNQISTHGSKLVQSHPRAAPATATSSSTTTPSPRSPPTAPAAPRRNSPPAPPGPTPGCSSSAPTGARGIPTASPNASGASSNAPAYPRSGCTTCATAPPPWPSTPVSTSKSSRNNSATPPPPSPATPTRAWSNACTTPPPMP